jgi:hypothetical protein
MAKRKPFNLFAYGTLMHPWVFRAVLGRRLVTEADQADNVESFHARPAILDGYEKASPDSTYQYALEDPHGRINGYVIGPLPGECLSLLLKYEGDNYLRRRVRVQTADSDEDAVVFVGNMERLEFAFGYEHRDLFKQEVLLGEKIDAALLATEQQQLNTTEDITRRAMAELHGDMIRDLQRQHFDSGGISDYAIRQSLADTPLPNFDGIRDNPEAQALSDNYLRFVVRQVILNQVEDHIHHDCRYELDRLKPSDAYYNRSLSLLTAMRVLNNNPGLDPVVQRCLDGLSFQEHDLLDYVQQAIVAADDLCDPALARQELAFIGQHTHRGHIPLGAEVEFSDIGHNVILDPEGHRQQDRRFDGFLFFHEFALGALSWRVGGHIDDHHDKAARSRRRGFFEAALGNLSVRAGISKPVTNDPWTLSQLIHQTRCFYDVAPHSVHISLQLRSHQPPVEDRAMPLAVMKCLFALAGHPTFTEAGQPTIARLAGEEIQQREPLPTLMFSHVSRRHSTDAADSHALVGTAGNKGTFVQQFKFLRLAPHLNYEPIILALKGLQIRLKPGSFLVGEQYRRVPRLRRLCDTLLAWGRSPSPLSTEDIEAFLSSVYEGLMTERRGKPVHSEAYIHWSMDQLRAMLNWFNVVIEASSAPT